MELPQQQRLFEAEGRKPTHDFLSLYSHSTLQQDPRPPPPPSSQGFLKTQDFLQPLERVGKGGVRKEEAAAEVSSLEKPPPPAPPPPPSVEHILPGGIGTYSISHISNYFNQRVPKPEGSPIFSVAQASSADKNEEHSNCSSYTGSGFTLWEESEIKNKGKTGKENVVERSNVVREGTGKTGHWTTSDKPSPSSTSNHRNSFTSQPSGQKSQSFMEMINSAKDSTQDDNLDEEEEFILKKEISSPIHTGELRVKVDGKSTDQKANTPRSKHSATEQRRRSKINDRFQMLRGLIPHGDQKRDKASFLLEVIEYIQFLQEKVHKNEESYQGWNHEPAKLVPWRNGNLPAERAINAGSNPALIFAAKLEEKNMSLSQTIPGTIQNPVEPDVSPDATFRMEHHPGMRIPNKEVPFPVTLQPKIFNCGRNGSPVIQLPPRLTSDIENTATQPQPQSNQTRSYTADGCDKKLKEEELSIEGGTINISSAYSQGLLNTLTRALQSSGVDLSQASISVQIDLGKRANRTSNVPTSILKENETPCSNQGTIRPRVSDGENSCDHALKKLKTSKS
ncbi:transcription factor BIM1 isoform X2 [Mercurialis annua]|uniref:transcription factor BIM1 isoform X2 n=1 Tax=Mercurialis annua TaxID=3986 RepID=UPI00215E67F1|nr:transcription factor BIM1 isoform X2 [Mercurialis annua]